VRERKKEIERERKKKKIYGKEGRTAWIEKLSFVGL